MDQNPARLIGNLDGPVNIGSFSSSGKNCRSRLSSPTTQTRRKRYPERRADQTATRDVAKVDGDDKESAPTEAEEASLEESAPAANAPTPHRSVILCVCVTAVIVKPTRLTAKMVFEAAETQGAKTADTTGMTVQNLFLFVGEIGGVNPEEGKKE